MDGGRTPGGSASEASAAYAARMAQWQLADEKR
jgi:hypothetical protein